MSSRVVCDAVGLWLELLDCSLFGGPATRRSRQRLAVTRAVEATASVLQPEVVVRAQSGAIFRTSPVELWERANGLSARIAARGGCADSTRQRADAG